MSSIDTTGQLVKKFEAANPSIHVNVSYLTLTQEETGVLATRLRSGDGPDVFQYGPGPTFSGVLASAGLLENLAPIYPKLLQFFQWAKQQVTVGGKLIMLPDHVDDIGVFYNKNIFAKYKLTPPTTVPQLLAMCGTLNAHGIIPMSLSAQIAGLAGHLLSMALSSALGRQSMNNLITGSGSWNSPPVTSAIQASFVTAEKNNCFEKEPVSVNYNEAQSLFYSGKAAMFPTGAWLIGSIEQAMGGAKSPVGLFPYPGPTGPGILTTGLSSGLFISAKTQHLAAAEKFLEFEGGNSATAQSLLQQGYLPGYPVQLSPTALGNQPLLKIAFDDTQKFLKEPGHAGYNIDVFASQKVSQAMYNGIQAVLNGSETAKQLSAGLEAAKMSS